MPAARGALRRAATCGRRRPAGRSLRVGFDDLGLDRVAAEAGSGAHLGPRARQVPSRRTRPYRGSCRRATRGAAAARRGHRRAGPAQLHAHRARGERRRRRAPALRAASAAHRPCKDYAAFRSALRDVQLAEARTATSRSPRRMDGDGLRRARRSDPRGRAPARRVTGTLRRLRRWLPSLAAAPCCSGAPARRAADRRRAGPGCSWTTPRGPRAISMAVGPWLSMLAEEPSHPLAEATLRLASLQQDDAADAGALAHAVAGLPSAAVAVGGASARAAGQRAARHAPGGGQPPDHLSRFPPSAFVLGPLPPLDDPLAEREPSPSSPRPALARRTPAWTVTCAGSRCSARPCRGPSSRPRCSSPRAAGRCAPFCSTSAGRSGVDRDRPAARGQRRAALRCRAERRAGHDRRALHDDAAPVERHAALLAAGRNRLVLKCGLDRQPGSPRACSTPRGGPGPA